ncbi:M48 family metallopeptidase [Thalassococcus sp. S3]|uniref:M48 family metallopeptidase n=1 Tax=Thalassococcus sp. S3 TaxID=2017482 RepID=UPI00102417AC|nr:M48 family metallopeptidase [Thalassococcus sp. S3]QBF30957.1 peptidase M48 [Thalassococcus sp. S3]
MRWLLLIGALALAACDVPNPDATLQAPASRPAGAPLSPAQAARSFVQVVDTLEPVAERECRARTRGVNCDFRIVVDDNRNAPPNAFQSLDRNGRPVITFTIALIADARNSEEIAFVMAHEAAHHIQGHLARQRQNAAAGAVIFAGLATLTGGTAADVESAQQLGAAVGARSYSKDFELEADELGTIIAYRAGYDPAIGAQFFNRIPDPGNRFLGTHPPNAARYQRVMATLRAIESD